MVGFRSLIGEIDNVTILVSTFFTHNTSVDPCKFRAENVRVQKNPDTDFASDCT